METIGLNFNDMANLLASSWEEARGTIESETKSSFEQYIEKGFSKDDAQFRSEITAQISSANIAVLMVIAANNGRILADLKKAGIPDR